MVLYKYMSETFGTALLQYGSFQIGTLYGYRRSELARGISDPTEGRMTVRIDIDEAHFETESDVPKRLATQGILELAPGAKVMNMRLSDIHTRMRWTSQDLYLWCASSELSRQAMQSVGGATMCIEISNLIDFFEVLSRHVPAEFRGTFPVEYRERVVDWKDSVHPALIKEDVSFMPQREVRAIWKPINMHARLAEIRGWAPELCKFCRRVEI